MTALTRIGAAGAGAILAVGLFAAPPAGAGADYEPRTEEQTKAPRTTCVSSDGKTQGRSMSDPDGMSNGGPDKPGCSAGTIDADRDGNNGCGNDADREDDNNGHCGRKAQSSPSGADETGESEEPSSTTTGEDPEPTTDPSEVDDDADADDADDTADQGDDADKGDDAVEDDDAGEDDAEKDDPLTSDDGTSDPSTESPDEPETLPIKEAGAGFGLLALLSGIARLCLRIG